MPLTLSSGLQHLGTSASSSPPSRRSACLYSHSDPAGCQSSHLSSSCWPSDITGESQPCHATSQGSPGACHHQWVFFVLLRFGWSILGHANHSQLAAGLHTTGNGRQFLQVIAPHPATSLLTNLWSQGPRIFQGTSIQGNVLGVNSGCAPPRQIHQVKHLHVQET